YQNRVQQGNNSAPLYYWDEQTAHCRRTETRETAPTILCQSSLAVQRHAGVVRWESPVERTGRDGSGAPAVAAPARAPRGTTATGGSSQTSRSTTAANRAQNARTTSAANRVQSSSSSPSRNRAQPARNANAGSRARNATGSNFSPPFTWDAKANPCRDSQGRFAPSSYCPGRR